jgi:Fe2+ or Zn2+ uptake regulation protein
MAIATTHNRVDVTLGTTEVVMSFLQEAGDPVSRNWLLEKLKESGHTTSRARLNRALTFCFELGLAIEGSKGIQWTHTTSPSLLRTLAKGRRL